MGRMFVSWNGATELRKWELGASSALGSSSTDWVHISTFERSGFESNVTIDQTKWTVFRLIALDKVDRKLGAWVVYSGGDVTAIPLPETHIPGIFLVLFGSVLTLILASVFRRRGDIIGRVRSRVPSSRGYLPVYNQANGSTKPKKLDLSEAEIAAHITSPTMREY